MKKSLKLLKIKSTRLITAAHIIAIGPPLTTHIIFFVAQYGFLHNMHLHTTIVSVFSCFSVFSSIVLVQKKHEKMKERVQCVIGLCVPIFLLLII